MGVSPGLADRADFLLMGCRVHMVKLQGNLSCNWDIPARTEQDLDIELFQLSQSEVTFGKGYLKLQE